MEKLPCPLQKGQKNSLSNVAKTPAELELLPLPALLSSCKMPGETLPPRFSGNHLDSVLLAFQQLRAQNWNTGADIANPSTRNQN